MYREMIVAFILAILILLAAVLMRATPAGKPILMKCGHENLWVIDEENPGFLLLHCHDTGQKFLMELIEE